MHQSFKTKNNKRNFKCSVFTVNKAFLYYTTGAFDRFNFLETTFCIHVVSILALFVIFWLIYWFMEMLQIEIQLDSI